METHNVAYDQGIEIALQQIAEHHGVKLQSSIAKKFIGLFREVQNRYRVTETTQIEIKQDSVNLLIYINSLLRAIARWEVNVESKLCQDFLLRIIALPKSDEKLTFCSELVAIFYGCQLDPCSQIVDILAKTEKNFLQAEADKKGLQLCLSCNKLTKGIKGETHFFCGFCGQTLITK